MGNRAWGMGKNIPMPNAPCDGATIPLHATCGMEFQRRFQLTLPMMMAMVALRTAAGIVVSLVYRQIPGDY